LGGAAPAASTATATAAATAAAAVAAVEVPRWMYILVVHTRDSAPAIVDVGRCASESQRQALRDALVRPFGDRACYVPGCVGRVAHWACAGYELDVGKFSDEAVTLILRAAMVKLPVAQPGGSRMVIAGSVRRYEYRPVCDDPTHIARVRSIGRCLEDDPGGSAVRPPAGPACAWCWRALHVRSLAACPRCALHKYCSVACATAHASTHLLSCPSTLC
jgi:hypothetical protein